MSKEIPEFGTPVKDVPEFGTPVQKPAASQPAESVPEFGTPVQQNVTPAEKTEVPVFGTPVKDVPEFGTPVRGGPIEPEVVDEEIRQAGLSDGRFWGGLGTQLVISEGGRIGGATAGAKLGAKLGAVGGPKGMAIGAGFGFVGGYLAGSIGGGAAGSIAAQKIEDNDKFSYGRLTTDTMLNMIPASALVRQGAKGAAKLKSAVARQALVGAGAGATGATLEAVLDEDEVPELRDIRDRAFMGSLLGGGLGLTTQGGSALLGRVTNKKSSSVDREALSNDPALVNFIDMVTTKSDMQNLSSREMLNVMSSRAMAEIAPSLKVSKGALNAIRDATSSTKLGETIGRDVNVRVSKAIKRLPLNERKQVNDELVTYLTGKTDKPPVALRSVQDDISQWSEQIKVMTGNLLNASREGRRVIPEHLKDSLAEQASQGRGWLTRSFRFWSDKGFNPTVAQRTAAKKELADDFFNEAQAAHQKAMLNAKRRNDKTGQFNSTQARKRAEELADEQLGSWNAVREARVDQRGREIDAGILEQKKDLGPAVREYLGEITDAPTMMEASITKLTKLGSWDKADGAVLQALRNAGLVRDSVESGSRRLNSKLTLRRGEVDGAFVDPEVNVALQRLYGDGNAAQASNLADSVIGDLYNAGISLWKFTKVPLNLASYSTNPITNFFQVLQQGMNPFIKSKKSIQVAGQTFDLVRQNLTGAKGRSYYNRLVELDLVQPGIAQSDILAGLNRGKIGSAIQKSSLIQVPGKAYSASDIALRVGVFENYMKNLRQEFIGIGSVIGEKRLQSIAANLTKDTYQQYSYLSPAVRSLSRLGVMNQFIAFTAELMRNQYNQGLLVRNMLNGRYAKEVMEAAGAKMRTGETNAQFLARAQQETGISVNQGAINKDAAKRIASTALLYGAATYGVSELNKKFGVTEKLYAAYEDLFAPPWAEGQQLIFKPQDDGTVEWMDASYILPQAQLAAPFMAAMRGEGFADSAMSGFKGLMNQASGELNFFLQALVPMFGNYDPRTRSQISTSESPFEQGRDRLAWFAATNEPGFYRELRSTFGEEATRTPKQFAQRMMGMRINLTSEQEGIRFAVFGVNDALSKSRRDYNRAERQNLLGRQGEQIEGEFRESFARMHRHVGSMRTLGMSDNAIAERLLDENFGGTNTLHAIQGTFPPIKRDRAQTVSGRWDQILEIDPKDRKSAIMASESREMRSALISRYRKFQRDKKRGVSPIDRIIRGQDVQDGGRAHMIWRMMEQSSNPDQVLLKFRRQGIATPQVVRQIRLKQGARQGVSQ